MWLDFQTTGRRMKNEEERSNNWSVTRRPEQRDSRFSNALCTARYLARMRGGQERATIFHAYFTFTNSLDLVQVQHFDHRNPRDAKNRSVTRTRRATANSEQKRVINQLINRWTSQAKDLCPLLPIFFSSLFFSFVSAQIFHPPPPFFSLFFSFVSKKWDRWIDTDNRGSAKPHVTYRAI